MRYPETLSEIFGAGCNRMMVRRKWLYEYDNISICHICGESDCKTPDACFEIEIDDPCDRCGKSCGNDVHETPDGYICDSCFQYDVARAEYMGEDR